ncbi:hypothetical protein ACWC91_27315, partial [Streptomyces sp. NPDC001204]
MSIARSVTVPKPVPATLLVPLTLQVPGDTLPVSATVSVAASVTVPKPVPATAPVAVSMARSVTVPKPVPATLLVPLTLQVPGDTLPVSAT